MLEALLRIVVFLLTVVLLIVWLLTI